MALGILMIVGAMGCTLGFVGMMTDQSGFVLLGLSMFIVSIIIMLFLGGVEQIGM